MADFMDFLSGLGNEMRGARYDLTVAEALVPRLMPSCFSPAIVVAGTNGKGSVSWWLSRVLRRSGFRVGLYTSPHLEDVRERIRLDGRMVEADLFLRQANRVLEEVRATESALPRRPTYYEWLTLVAAGCFHQADLDVHVLEVGMGGRLDAVNVARRILSVITTVDLDHQKFLGDTVEAIAREKMGILRGDAPVVLGPQDEWAGSLAGEIGQAAARVVRTRQIHDGEFGAPTGDDHRAGTYRLGLAGHYQRYNAATVVGACRELRRQGWRIPAVALRDGLAEGGWPGRLETVRHQPEIILDGSHNPQALREVVQELRRRSVPPVVVFGAMKDKDIGGMLRLLEPVARCVILSVIPGARSAGLEEYQTVIRPGRILFGGDIDSALKMARGEAADGAAIYVVGSLYLVAEARRHLAGSHKEERA